ncbi:hypothetical protein FACS1894103_5900 [Campylobacterota bacterium]|nr:hypothetical protein FACS1894103_5900 [Campylobacterota bacterium]
MALDDNDKAQFAEKQSFWHAFIPNFIGVAKRSEYWTVTGVLIAYMFVCFVAINWSNTGNSSAVEEMVGVITGIFTMTITVWLINCFVAVSVRRLHDMGQSGYGLFWNIVPIVSLVYWLYIGIANSKTDNNKYIDEAQDIEKINRRIFVPHYIGIATKCDYWIVLAAFAVAITALFVMPSVKELDSFAEWLKVSIVLAAVVIIVVVFLLLNSAVAVIARRLSSVGRSWAWVLLFIVSLFSTLALTLIYTSSSMRPNIVLESLYFIVSIVGFIFVLVLGTIAKKSNANFIDKKTQIVQLSQSAQPAQTVSGINDQPIFNDQLERLEKLQKLRDSGAITDDEFNDLKRKVLS